MNRLDSINSCLVCHVHVGDEIKKENLVAGESTVKKVDKLFKCSQCHVPNYCSKECQTIDWKARHKSVCKPLKEVSERLEKESKQWTGNKMIALQSPTSSLDEPLFRTDYWGRFAGFMVTGGLTTYLSKHLLEEVTGKSALDLGCGNSTSALYLLKKGWKVIGVDFSDTALNIFKRKVESANPEWLQTQQLSLVCSKIETYTLPSDLDLVIAGSSLPYCDPQKIHGIMRAIFSSLKKGGQLIGNIFILERISNHKFQVEREMGAWFLKDESQVRNLLLGHGFEVLRCEHVGEEHPDSILFIAKK